MPQDKKLHEHCLSLGLVKGTKEYKKAREAYRWQQQTYEQKKAKWTASYKRRVERLKTDVSYLEKHRARDRARKAKKLAANREKVNEYQRANYKRGGDQRRKSINDGKYKRDPTRGISTLIKDVRAGRREPRELIDRIRNTLDKHRA
jgi:hypothetical protein